MHSSLAASRGELCKVSIRANLLFSLTLVDVWPIIIIQCVGILNKENNIVFEIMECLSVIVYGHPDHLMCFSLFLRRFIKENYKNEDHQVYSINSFRKKRRFLLDQFQYYSTFRCLAMHDRQWDLWPVLYRPGQNNYCLWLQPRCWKTNRIRP